MIAEGATWTHEVPVRFDDYDVIRPLGAGGMGAVFLGHDRMLDRPVALKFIAGDSRDEHARERFLDEARALARLHHPNVAAIYRIGEVEGRPYLAYELVDGQPIHRMVLPVPWRRALELSLGMARGLAAVHESGVLHRDVKPSNVVVTATGVPKLIDFGLARRLDAVVQAPLVDDHAVAAALSSVDAESVATTIGAIAGTPHFMAPELWVGHPATAASDLYALGLVIWQMLVGETPYVHLDAEHVVASLAQPLPSIATKCDLPGPFAALIDQCVQRTVGARPASAAELRDRLEAIRAVFASLVPEREESSDGNAADTLAGSFGRATDQPDEFALRFYDRLFEDTPEARGLFPADLTGQRKKLVAALQTVIHHMRSPELLVPMLEDLGFRHAEYGVKAGHFDIVGRVLLATLAERDRAWSAELEGLWAHAYGKIADHMGRGLSRAVGSSPRRFTKAAPIKPGPPRYAADGEIAYQVVGGGGRDVVVLPGWLSHGELMWQHLGHAEMLAHLAHRSRVITYDRRGSGLSERSTDQLDLTRELADLIAVLDATGSERPVVLAIGDAAPIAVMLATVHPERVRALMLYGTSAKRAVEEGDAEQIRARWGEALFVERFAPSLANDDAFTTWWGKYLRSCASPGGAIALLKATSTVDVSALLPAVGVQTLVMHRIGDRVTPIAEGRALAAAIPGAQFVALPGDDHLPYVGDTAKVLAEIDGFLTDLPTTAHVPTRLITVVALRVGDGHDIAAIRQALGRERGTVLGTHPVITAIVDTPGAALRAIRNAARGSITAAGVHTTLTSNEPAEQVDAANAASKLAGSAPDGRILLSPLAHGLCGGEPDAPAMPDGAVVVDL